ncbi:MAG: DUF445 family protein [Flavobacteriales bacterium]|nr:DUF445 family protein [Flavobacteriales bacterium]MCB9190133.1 DUF445 family protein [Flavobacteriales bacterium]
MIYTLPFIAALVGWFTNYIAVKMLFHPKEPVNILGVYKLQGIFPKNQQKVAENIGRMVAEELLSSEDLREKLNNPENILSIKELVEAKIDYYLNVTFPKNYPITAAIVGDKRKIKLKEAVMTEVHESVPSMIDSYMANIEEKFNVEHIIQEKVNNLSPERLEDLIMKLLNKEFKFIEYIGAVIGFIIGWVQVLLVVL